MAVNRIMLLGHEPLFRQGSELFCKVRFINGILPIEEVNRRQGAGHWNLCKSLMPLHQRRIEKAIADRFLARLQGRIQKDDPVRIGILPIDKNLT